MSDELPIFTKLNQGHDLFPLFFNISVIVQENQEGFEKNGFVT
jgi:hypothetical protein